MEQLSKRITSCERALKTLAEILETPFSIIVRDVSIQRFEYSFESTWKMLKVYLKQQEGIVCNSPKRCFREALRAGLLSPEDVETCLAMTDDRNLTAHTYIEAIAEAIYEKLPVYLTVMRRTLDSVKALYE